MRIRHKPWARPELAACVFFIDEPKEMRGRWAESYPKKQPLHLELGCGKGGFISELAVSTPKINYLAVDIKSEMLGLAKRKCEASYAGAGRSVDNLLLTAYDIERIEDILSPEDVVERIYINFCNPWPKQKQHKKRLVHTRQLEHYKTFLASGGEIRFRTDDDGLFRDAAGYLAECGFEILYQTFDLHSEPDPPAERIETEHEKMFSDEGITIKYLSARLKSGEMSVTNA